MRQVISTIYTYDELSEAAKVRARDNWREVEDFTFAAECVMDDAKAIARLMGIAIDNIYYSGFGSQGDGACFVGSYEYKKGALKAVKSYAPRDKELHRIAKELQEIQRRNFYRINARSSHTGSYSHENSVTVNVERNDDVCLTDRDENDITDALRDYMRWIYRNLEREYEWINEDAQVEESILANHCEFDENGNFA